MNKVLIPFVSALISTSCLAGNPICYSCYMSNSDPNKALMDGLKLGVEMRARKSATEAQDLQNKQYAQENNRKNEYQEDVRRIIGLPIDQRKQELIMLMIKYPEYEAAISTSIELMDSIK